MSDKTIIILAITGAVLVGGYLLYENFINKTSSTATQAVHDNALQIGEGIGVGVVTSVVGDQ